jgi:hypothetical protein
MRSERAVTLTLCANCHSKQHYNLKDMYVQGETNKVDWAKRTNTAGRQYSAWTRLRMSCLCLQADYCLSAVCVRLTQSTLFVFRCTNVSSKMHITQ